MIKFTAKTGADRTLIGIGLSAVNVEKLKAGQPIHIHFEELGLPWKADLAIMYGETEDSIQAELQDLITPKTDYADQRKKKGH